MNYLKLKNFPNSLFHFSLSLDQTTRDVMNSNKIDLGLKGKTIFITGASRGIGLAIALR